MGIRQAAGPLTPKSAQKKKAPEQQKEHKQLHYKGRKIKLAPKHAEERI
jgi:hypothetical protein